MKNFFREFKEFATRGNVIDLAVGIIIGASFNKIVSSLVADVVTPVIGILSGRIDFTTRVVTVGSAELKYGIFIQNILDFIVVAFVLFLVISAINKLKRKQAASNEPAPPAPPTKEEALLIEIRDLLAKKQ